MRVVPGVPDCTSAAIRGGRLAVTTNELRDIFDEVVDNVIELAIAQIEGISSQIDSSRVAAIVLVGGFGESQYLQQCLREHPDLAEIPLLSPPNA
jgi:tRNA A37 threonylcarbamoyltransferase TsaD